jgi:tRNA pseudouridine55 synthase
MKGVEQLSLINGILLLNKPQGMTSNKALQKVKNLLGVKKGGHTGSLDPLATGMLPLCFNQATKVCQFLLDANKCYQTTGMLGIKTTTSDSTGDVLSYSEAFRVSETQLSAVLNKYKGTIKQIPSMYSALKHQGIPLYRLAREGVVDVKPEPREIEIKELTLTAFDGLEFSLTVTCSKGTYIRNLVEDIGDALGVGAHVTRLHRLYTAGLEDLTMHTLEELEARSLAERLKYLIPMDKAVAYLNSLVLMDQEIALIRQGKILDKPLNKEKMGWVRLYDKQSRFIGLGEITIQGVLKAKRLLAF